MGLSFSGSRKSEEEGEWISISDLMSGLMVIFLFIAIVYIQPLADSQQKVRDIAVTWKQSESQIYEALNTEFRDDLRLWGAELDPRSLEIRFTAPDVLFYLNEAKLQPRFEAILSDFLPRYLAVLNEFTEVIEEVRIEGHTSSEWNSSTPPDKAYFLNMALSQERTRSVLEFMISLPSTEPYRAWAYKTVTANGLSSSQPVLTVTGQEDAEASRRVVFGIRTNSESQIVKILDTVE